jgi:undecaprenyl-diphosphatase
MPFADPGPARDQRLIAQALRLVVWAAALASLGCLAGLGLGDGPSGPDRSVMEWFVDERRAWLTSAAKALSALGSATVLGVVVALAAAWLLLRRRPDDAVSIAVTAVGSVALANLIKVVVDRPRPATLHLVAVASASFPSQHAAQAAAVLPALALVLAYGRLRTALLVVAVSLAIAIGLSRIYLGVHYPTDVLAGWALGAAWLAVVRNAEVRSGRRSLS